MPVKVGEFDIEQPVPLWGMENYSSALVLIKRGSQPLGLIDVPRPQWLSAIPAALVLETLRERRPDLLSEPASSATLPVSHPPFTVVVCTRNRPDSLSRTLDSLLRIDYPRYEVVVVDNRSDGNVTAEIVARFPFRYIREDHQGLDWARNRGAREANYDLIAYIDDDARADPAWLRGYAGAFSDETVEAATGLVLPAELNTAAQQTFEAYGGMGKGFRTRRFHRSSLTERQLIASHSVGVGANMAFRRRVLESVGWFDCALDVGTPASGAGDLDMFHRILASGFTILYQPAAFVWHQHRRDREGLNRQIFNNGRSFGVYLLKIRKAGSVSGLSLLSYIWHDWWGGWLLPRIGRSIRRRPGAAPDLVWLELRGLLTAPWAYYETYRRTGSASSLKAISASPGDTGPR